MLKIHHHFFINFLGLFVGTLLFASIISYITLKSVVIDNNQERLKQGLDLIGLQLASAQELDSFVRQAHEATKLRITVVNRDGIVISESNTDKEKMENHANRVEIMESASQPYGVSIRYSSTLKTDFLYVAKRTLYRDYPVTLRLSTSLESVMKDFYKLWTKLALVFTFFVLLALMISYKMSKKIQYDITQITRYLDEISNNNYKAIIKTRFFNEFLQISLLLKNLVKKLQSREKQKRKYTAKLRLVNKQRNDILSAISHEFKNPIASIMGYAETLRDDPETDVKIRTKFLDKILGNGKKISAMLDRLALSVKLENEDLSIKPTDFDLDELCQEAVANLSKKYIHRNITYKGLSTPVHADKTMLELVIVNLVDNALKYSEDDVTVTIKNDRLMVTDKGMGIEKGELDKIASKFYRVSKNTWDNSMGLGLAIVSYILKLHDTSLIIESKVGKGSRFGFEISKLRK